MQAKLREERERASERERERERERMYKCINAFICIHARVCFHVSMLCVWLCVCTEVCDLRAAQSAVRYAGDGGPTNNPTVTQMPVATPASPKGKPAAIPPPRSMKGGATQLPTRIKCAASGPPVLGEIDMAPS